MRPIRWDDGTRWDDPNARWGSPSYVLEPGDPGYIAPPGTLPPPSTKKKRIMSSNPKGRAGCYDGRFLCQSVLCS